MCTGIPAAVRAIRVIHILFQVKGAASFYYLSINPGLIVTPKFVYHQGVRLTFSVITPKYDLFLALLRYLMENADILKAGSQRTGLVVVFGYGVSVFFSVIAASSFVRPVAQFLSKRLP